MFDPETRTWDGAADPLDVVPADVRRDLLPGSLEAGGLGALADAVGAELARLAPAVRLAAVLPRLGEDAPSPLPRAELDGVAALFGVDFYPPSATDQRVREMVRGALTWHRRRGTAWAVRWALDAVGQPVAGGVDGDDGTEVDPTDGETGAAVEVVEQGTARYDALADSLPAPAGDDEFYVVVDLEAIDEPAWGPWVGRAVRLAAPAARRAVWVLHYAGSDADAYEVGQFYARLGLGRGYALRSLPELNGRPLDGTWTLGWEAVVATPTDRPLEPAFAPPALYLVETLLADPEAAPSTPEAYERYDLRADRGGAFSLRDETVSYRGADYDLTWARPRPFALVFAAGAVALRDRDTATALAGSRSVAFYAGPDPLA